MMNVKNILILFLTLLSISLSAESSNCTVADSQEVQAVYQNIITHRVTKSETVYSIARAYNTTVEEIYRLNPYAAKGIKAGDVLRIARKSSSMPIKYSSHLIEPKETLYSVARMYDISVQDIIDVNEGLNESTFSVGRTIQIPFFDKNRTSADAPSYTPPANVSHKVKKQETLYSIGKMYDISTDALVNANPIIRKDGLKNGMILTIPLSTPSSDTPVPVKPDLQLYPVTNENPVRVGILLPFLDDKGTVQKDKLIEYYQGFLIAVEDMKQQKLNAEIYTFDTGKEDDTKKLEGLLGTTELNNLDLIIGGVSKPQEMILSRFSKEKGINYVVPFKMMQDIASNPNMFSMIATYPTLYPKIISGFIKNYRGYNIIIVSEAGSDNNKADFTEALKKALIDANISFITISGSTSVTNDLNREMSSTMPNVVIPTSSSESTLRKVNFAISTHSPETVTLFGYPEWQTYTRQLSNLRKYESTIYTTFFADERQANTQRFDEQYKKWYNKNLINSFPKYGYLGYDTGLYFLTALKRYGNRFDQFVTSISVPTIQSAISFDKVSSEGGFVNTGLYFVKYKTDSNIEKTNID